MTSHVESVARDVATALAAFRTVLSGRSATYVAVPMTTGPRFLVWLEQTGSQLVKGSAEYVASWRRDVWEPNLAEAAAKISALRPRIPGPIIDPTRFDAHPEWTQTDYHELWSMVFADFVRGLVVLDGWEYSIGCTMELDAALKLGIPIVTETLESLDVSTAPKRIEVAIHRITAVGHSTTELEGVLRSIRLRLEGRTER